MTLLAAAASAGIPVVARAENPLPSPPPAVPAGISEGIFEAKSDPLQPIKGPRMPGGAEVETPKEREWFGQSTPWWQWSRLTGDWAGPRTYLEDKGVAFGLSYTFDGGSVLKGGVRRHSVARGLLDLNVTIDTEKLAGLKGGTFFAQYYYRHGRSGTEDVGDVQGYSNIDAERLSRAEEVWYEQTLLNDRLRFKVGQVDANAEFAFVDAAGEFIQPSAGYSPTIAFFPTYPDPAVSANVFVHPTDQFYLGGGVYTENFKQLDTDSFERPFLIGEIGLTHEGNGGRYGAGRLAFGAWRETAQVDRFDGSTEVGTTGYYLVGEQVVWKENVADQEDAQGVSLLGQYGWADEDVSPFEQHVAFGVAATGLIHGRDEDATGLRYCWLGLSRAPGSGFETDESSLEFFYKAQITPFFSVKPGLQWIHRPGGLDDADDAVVGTLRASFDF